MFRLEVQIRTEEMNLIAERGIVAHYSGKKVVNGLVRHTMANDRYSSGKPVYLNNANVALRVAPTLVPLLKFYFHEEVRKAAVSAMPELLKSAKLAIEKGLAQGRDGSYLIQLFDYIVPALVEALHKICGQLLD